MVNRLLRSMRLDIDLQIRNYLYHITLVLAVLVGGGMSYGFGRETLRLAVPTFFLLASAGTGYLFVAALILFEKREGTLHGLVVTPLRPREYLISKAVTLTLLGALESLLLLTTAYIWWYGLDFNLLLFALGMVGVVLIFTLVGIIMVVRFDDINSFLMPSILIGTVGELPVLAGLGVWEPWFMYLIPVYPSYILMLAAFEPVAGWRVAYGVIATAVWCLFFFWWAERAFDKYVVQNLG